MSDAECPYCGEFVEINHDDGYGYDESEKYEQECSNCGKTFAFMPCIHYSYSTNKAACLNGGEHDMQPVWHVPHHWPDWARCRGCGYEVRGEYRAIETQEVE